MAKSQPFMARPMWTVGTSVLAVLGAAIGLIALSRSRHATPATAGEPA